jgi:ABC-type glutathione transport system ATPase component
MSCGDPREATGGARLRSGPRTTSISAHTTYRSDSLTGAQSFEAELSRAVRSGERVALVGPSGGGKSSVVASTFGPLEEGIAPIRVRVRACGRRNRHDTT